MFIPLHNLRGRNWVHFAHRLFREFKLCYLKTLKLFSIRVKKLFEPTVNLRKKSDGFLLFLKAFSSETDL